MKHVAIDLGGRESQMCVRGQDGTILDEKRVFTKSLPKLLAALEASTVIVETSAEAFRVADAAKQAGHRVSVVPATLVKQLGVGARGVKTDRRDAQALSLASCRMELGSVHIPSESSRQLKSICGSREALVHTRTLLINNARGWLRTQLMRPRSGRSETFAARLREHAATHGFELPTHIERDLIVIETINAQIKAADHQLRELAGNNEVCRRLMTVPGVGAVTAVRFFAAIDQVSRFPTAHAVQSYLGLTPGERSSSERKQLTGITKAGPKAVRWTLIQAALVARRIRPNDPMVQWSHQIEQRRGRFIAVVALARKMAGILYAIWRDATTYQPSRGTTPA
ncbi:MAG: IS110 family transposase [Deltaproteobacteria bacterium]|nr:IS110 family transposase [Deltaproteobacteria bacterium]